MAKKAPPCTILGHISMFDIHVGIKEKRQCDKSPNKWGNKLSNYKSIQKYKNAVVVDADILFIKKKNHMISNKQNG